MGLRAGLLRETITILRPIVSRNDYGEQTTTWETVASTRARVDFRNGSRAVDVHEVTNLFTVTFIIRRFYQVDGHWRIRWKDRIYNIESVNEEPTRQSVTIIASVINE